MSQSSIRNMASTTTPKMAALLALYDLGGDHRAVDTEDVAMRAAQVAPKAFRWKRYPEQVNLEAVRLSLKHNKEQIPALVSGGIRDGWQLTQEGVKACVTLRGRPTVAKSEEEAEWIRQSNVFTTWRKNGEDAVTRTALLELLRVNDYFPEAKRRQRVVAFVNAAVNDPELEAFVAVLQHRYPEVMRI